MNIRRSLVALVAILTVASVFAGVALAETPVYIQYGDSGDPIGWLQDCLGVDENYKYYYGDGTVPYFGDDTLYAVEALQQDYGLPVSGMFDDETLYLILDPAYSAMDGYEDPLVWIPMYGGACYHEKYWCSGLVEPRQMPASCAEALGFAPCGRCYN